MPWTAAGRHLESKFTILDVVLIKSIAFAFNYLPFQCTVIALLQSKYMAANENNRASLRYVSQH